MIGQITTWVRRRGPAEGSFARNVSVLLAGTASAQLLGLLLMPVITRLYTPDGFGILGSFTAIVLLVGSFGTLQYHMGIPLAEDSTTMNSLLILCLGILGIVASLVGLGIYFFQEQLGSHPFLNSIQPYWMLIPVMLLIICSYEVFDSVAVRNQHFKPIAQCRVTLTLTTLLTQLSLGFLSFGTVGLIAGDLCGKLAALLLMLKSQIFQQRLRIQFSWRNVTRAASQFRNFAIFSAPSTLLNRGANRLPIVLILTYYGPHAAGLFALTEMVLRSPIALFAQSISKVYVGEASKCLREAPETLPKLFCSVAFRLFLMGCLPCLLVLLFGPWGFRTLFGDRWEVSGEFARFMSIGILLRFIASPVSQTLNLLHRQNVQLGWDILFSVLTVGGLTIPAFLGGDIQVAILAYSGCLIVSYLTLIVLIAFYSFRTRSAHNS